MSKAIVLINCKLSLNAIVAQNYAIPICLTSPESPLFSVFTIDFVGICSWYGKKGGGDGNEVSRTLPREIVDHILHSPDSLRYLRDGVWSPF